MTIGFVSPVGDGHELSPDEIKMSHATGREEPTGFLLQPAGAEVGEAHDSLGH